MIYKMRFNIKQATCTVSYFLCVYSIAQLSSTRIPRANKLFVSYPGQGYISHIMSDIYNKRTPELKVCHIIIFNVKNVLKLVI